jgi:hypothetical protein
VWLITICLTKIWLPYDLKKNYMETYIPSSNTKIAKWLVINHLKIATNKLNWLDIHWIKFCPVDNSHNSLHFLCKSNPDHKLKKKGLLSSAIFQVIFQAVQFICCDLQMIYDQSFCYLCVGTSFNLFKQIFTLDYYFMIGRKKRFRLKNTCLIHCVSKTN